MAPLCAPVAQLDRASDYESEGQEFESLRARHFPLKNRSLKITIISGRTISVSVPQLCPTRASVSIGYPLIVASFLADGHLGSRPSVYCSDPRLVQSLRPACNPWGESKSALSFERALRDRRKVRSGYAKGRRERLKAEKCGLSSWRLSSVLEALRLSMKARRSA